MLGSSEDIILVQHAVICGVSELTSCLHGACSARRLQLSPWESSIVSRLLTPTHSFLARSKSTAALSGDAGKPLRAEASCLNHFFFPDSLWVVVKLLL